LRDFIDTKKPATGTIILPKDQETKIQDLTIRNFTKKRSGTKHKIKGKKERHSNIRNNLTRQRMFSVLQLQNSSHFNSSLHLSVGKKRHKIKPTQRRMETASTNLQTQSRRQRKRHPTRITKNPPKIQINQTDNPRTNYLTISIFSHSPENSLFPPSARYQCTYMVTSSRTPV
jgi:hypothetical protein